MRGIVTYSRRIKKKGGLDSKKEGKFVKGSRESPELSQQLTGV